MNIENIPTPETEKEIEENRGSIPKYGWAEPDKCRELERRLAIAREALKIVHADSSSTRLIRVASEALIATAPNP